MCFLRLCMGLFLLAVFGSSFAYPSSTEIGTYADPGYYNDRFTDYPYFQHDVDRPPDVLFNNENPSNWRVGFPYHLPDNTVVLKDSRKNLYAPCRADYDVHILYGRSDGRNCYVRYRGNVHAIPHFEVWTAN